MTQPGTKAGTLTLMGSGELAPGMSKVHRSVADRVTGALRPVVVDTPAGFEPNCDDIAAKAVAYLEQHLRARCAVASYAGPDRTPDADVERAVSTLRQANYIFSGPGSPTYAVRCWSDSPILAALSQRLAAGAQLVFASAASIAIGAQTLPVYEIFKAGHDLHWVDGTDLLGTYGIRIAVIPHWNNREGGTYDTSCCFMGRLRFERLEAMLDARTVVLGIDEHTACTLDLAADVCTVTGAGSVTVRRAGRQSVHDAGSTFSLAELRAETPPSHLAARVTAPEAQPDDRHQRLLREMAAADGALRGDDGLTTTASRLFALAAAIDGASDADVDPDTTDAAYAKLALLVDGWSRRLGQRHAAATGEIAPLVDMLISVRAKLREEGRWTLADEIRDRLASLGIVLEDTPGQTTWRATSRSLPAH